MSRHVVTTYSIAECEAGTASTRTCFIDNATSSTYIPVAADAGSKLHARAVYKDTLGDDSAVKTSEQDSVVRPTSNARPRFLDKGPVERDVVENVKDASVGDPVAATDTDPLLYELKGDDAASFKIDNSGQIQTKVKLDYESKSSYTVTVIATDPSLASASIVVNINVTDEDDAAEVTLLTGNAPIDYAENGTEPVGSFDADDQDGDAPVWSKSGPDAGDFDLSDDGVLSFKKSPNFESPADADGDNVYMVTVSASGGSTDVAVTVTNVDESGKVTIDDLQPQAGAGQSVSASVSDVDGDVVNTTWQWSRSMDMSEWADIEGATSSSYTPQEEDEGYYLRATASYIDGVGDGRDDASAETAFPVELRPPANFAPSFEVQDETGPTTDDDTAIDGVQDNIVVTRTVKETAKVGSSVGAPVVATDEDNDPLLYSLADYDDPTTLGDLNGDGDFDDTFDETATDTDDIDGDGDTTETIGDLNGDGDALDTAVAEAEEIDDSRWFKIDPKTGQISVKTPTDQAAVTAALQQDTESPTEEFKIMVTAMDPSGAPAGVMVTIEVAAVDEAPGIKAATDLDDDVDLTAITDPFNVKTKEEVQLDPRGVGDDTGLVDTLPIFEATDPEGMVAGAGLEDERIKWSVSGPDAKRFEIVKLPDTHNNVEPGDDQKNGAAGVNDNPDTADVNEAVGGFFVDGTGDPVAGVEINGDPAAGLTDDPQTVFDLRLDGKVKGALRFTKPYPSFEKMDSADGDNVYEVVVRVTDGKTNSSETVTVTVENVPEAGTVTLSQRRPQEGIPITAGLTDKDVGVSGTEWQWYRGPGSELDTRGKLLDTDDDGDFDGIDRDFDGDLNGYDLNGDGNVDEGDDDAADLNGDGDTLDTVTIDGTDVVEAEAGEQWLERFTEVADPTGEPEYRNDV